MRIKVFGNDERGSAIAEFAIVAGFFFMILISVVEFSRLLYIHNALSDATRRGARYAALHRKVNEDCAKNIVIYGESHVDQNCTPTGAPLVNGLAEANVNVVYEGADTDNDPDDLTPIDTSYGTNLGTVTVTIQDYKFNLLVPYMHMRLSMPDYCTTLTAESAGEEPEIIVAP
jgi:Flp pilus assembly protein TadG